MEYSLSQLIEAKRQIESTLHKIREAKKSMIESQSNHRNLSQITLASRRIEAFELSIVLIDKEIDRLDEANLRK